MTRKVEKGEPLKVGDRIELVDGRFSIVKRVSGNAVLTEGDSVLVLGEPMADHILATASITREEPEGKWTWDDVQEVFVDPDDDEWTSKHVAQILNDQAATIERLKKVMLECVSTLGNATNAWDAIPIAVARLRQEASK